MKTAFILCMGLAAFFVKGFSQEPACACCVHKIESAIVPKPSEPGIVEVTCSTLVVRWKGAPEQSYLVTGTFTGTPDITCDNGFICTATIPVTPSTKVSWNVQASSIIEGRTFYSYPLRGNQDYDIPACPFNNPPVASAGPDFSISTNSTILNAWGSFDPDGGPINFFWTKIGGPQFFNLLYEGSSTPVVSNLDNGTYTFRLTVSDSQGATASDEVDVHVSIPPIAPKDEPIPAQAATRQADPLNNSSNEVKIVIYPNPVIDALSIKWTGRFTGNARLTVMDVSGKAVKTFDIIKQHAEYTDHLRLGSLKPGLYYVGIKMEDGRSFITRFMKN